MLYSFPHLKHLQCDNVEYFPHGEMATVNYGQGKLFLKLQQKLTRLFSQSLKIKLAWLMSQGCPELSQNWPVTQIFHLPWSSHRARHLAPQPRNSPPKGREGQVVGGNGRALITCCVQSIVLGKLKSRTTAVLLKSPHTLTEEVFHCPTLQMRRLKPQHLPTTTQLIMKPRSESSLSPGLSLPSVKK